MVGLGGVDMDLSMVLPQNNVSFHARIAHLLSFSAAQRTVAPSVIPPEVSTTLMGAARTIVPLNLYMLCVCPGVMCVYACTCVCVALMRGEGRGVISCGASVQCVRDVCGGARGRDACGAAGRDSCA